MKLTRMGRWGIPPLVLVAALPALADTQFRVRRMTRGDVPLGKGQCDIRLQVDSEVEVALHRDFLNIRTVSGRDAQDDGSECNAPLPDRPVEGFNFEVKDSRGDIRLIAEPNRRTDYSAVVRIRDGSGGYGRYHFRITWMMTGSDYRREHPGSFREVPDERPLAWNNVLHFSSPGRGASNLSGSGPQRLFAANVDIDRGGRVQVSFRTDGGRPLVFSGTVMGREGETLKADMMADDRMLRLRGPMYISMDARQNVYRIWLEATNGRDRLRLDWDRR